MLSLRQVLNSYDVHRRVCVTVDKFGFDASRTTDIEDLLLNFSEDFLDFALTDEPKRGRDFLSYNFTGISGHIIYLIEKDFRSLMTLDIIEL